MKTIIGIESFNQYKKDYRFYSPLQSIKIAERVERLTLDEKTRKKAIRLRKTSLNARRDASISDEIHFSYALYLMNYVSLLDKRLYEQRIIFDHIYNTIKNIKGFHNSMNNQLLKNIVDEVR